jgi:hemin uptake protein HemP
MYETLMEKDFRDDCLGTGTVTSDTLGQGQQEINFEEDGAHYQLIDEVIA